MPRTSRLGPWLASILLGCVSETVGELDVQQPATILDTLEDGDVCVEEHVLVRTPTATANYENTKLAIAAALDAISEVKRVTDDGQTLRAGYGCPPGAARFRYRIRFPAGDFFVDPGGAELGVTGTRRDPAIRIAGAQAANLGARRELVLQGAGRNATRIRAPWDVRWIHGVGASHVTVRELTLQQDSPHAYKVSQGRIRTIGTSGSFHYVDLAIDAGFPHPHLIDQDEGGCRRWFADPTRCRGQKWLRRYELFQGDPASPRMIPTRNDQVSWVGADRNPVPGFADTYRVYLDPRSHPAAGSHPYAGFAQARLAIKSKHANPDAYRFVGGSDIRFSNVRLVNETRGLFDSVDRVTIENVIAVPLTANAALASSGGGPQFRGGTGHVAVGNRLLHLGDDALGYHASVTGSSATANTITDNFARGIFIEGPASGVRRSDNRLARNYPNELVVPASTTASSVSEPAPDAADLADRPVADVW